MSKIRWQDSFEPRCVQRHLGLWAIEAVWFSQAVAAFNAGHTVPAIGQATPGIAPAVQQKNGLITNEDGDIALIGMFDQLQKTTGKNGGTSTIGVRRQLRQAAQSNSIRGIFMTVDSPGGHVAGTHELMEDIKAASRAKPLFVQGEDLVASAALEAISPATFIAANKPAQIGSIGTIAIVHDHSKQFETEGIKTHVITNDGGTVKGSFAPGAEVTEEQIANLQGRVNEFNEFFIKAIASNRSIPVADVREMSTGELFMANRAKELGLIDAVQSADETFKQLQRQIRMNNKRNNVKQVKI